MSISQQDLNVRLQLTGCKYGELANRYANDLKYGKKCATSNLKNLALLNAYIELLECYKVNTVETQSQGSIQITNVTIGFSLEILINGLIILPTMVSPSDNENVVMEFITDYINTHQNTYNAELNTTNDLYKIDIYGPCTGGIITYTTDATGGEITLTVEDLNGGNCSAESNNCITEFQLNTIVDNISKLTKICFQPLGYTYTE